MSRLWSFVKARPWLVVAVFFALVPWVVFGVYLPIFKGVPLSAPTAWRVFFTITDVFAPLYYLADGPGGPMAILADHTTDAYQFWSWTFFSLLNFGFWSVVFGALAWAIGKVRAAAARWRARES